MAQAAAKRHGGPFKKSFKLYEQPWHIAKFDSVRYDDPHMDPIPISPPFPPQHSPHTPLRHCLVLTAYPAPGATSSRSMPTSSRTAAAQSATGTSQRWRLCWRRLRTSVSLALLPSASSPPPPPPQIIPLGRPDAGLLCSVWCAGERCRPQDNDKDPCQAVLGLCSGGRSLRPPDDGA